jgi:hypothetical protein
MELRSIEILLFNFVYGSNYCYILYKLYTRIKKSKFLKSCQHENLPEVVEAVQEGGFVAQQNSVFFSFWNLDLWPGGHIAQSLVRQSKPVV